MGASNVLRQMLETCFFFRGQAFRFRNKFACWLVCHKQKLLVFLQIIWIKHRTGGSWFAKEMLSSRTVAPDVTVSWTLPAREAEFLSPSLSLSLTPTPHIFNWRMLSRASYCCPTPYQLSACRGDDGKENKFLNGTKKCLSTIKGARWNHSTAGIEL